MASVDIQGRKQLRRLGWRGRRSRAVLERGRVAVTGGGRRSRAVLERGRVAATGGGAHGKPVLRTFKFLRVLDVEDNGNLRSHHLKGIGGLILARAIVDFLRAVGHSNLQSLSLHCLDGDLVGQMDLCPYQLPRFELTISGAILGSAAFCMAPCVTHLNIEISQLGEQGLSIIASAPHLILLKLVSTGPVAAMTDTHSSSRRQRRRVIISSGAFPCLKVFWFTCKAGGNELQFDRGAMPRLRGLRLHFNALETMSLYGDFEFGIEHLSSLTRIHAAIGCVDSTAPEVELAEAAITEHVCRISSANTPTIEFSREKTGMFEGGKKSIGPLTETVTMITRKKSFSRWLIAQYKMMQRALCSCSCAGCDISSCASEVEHVTDRVAIGGTAACFFDDAGGEAIS
ncbi:disease resistance protein RGA5-like [Triticum dicoccoides]|uniref:disease resistance protein RGA5-like n=1 Tax=Triticum dicoccoides TaxID=85692 RepID=UPI00188FCBE3|nr:disease resistance protein RGA5-like [Triticum dicoccoides]